MIGMKRGGDSRGLVNCSKCGAVYDITYDVTFAYT